MVVFVFASILEASFLISYLKGDYPPDPEELRLSIEAWGEFAMLPFVKIPAESYRLTIAIFMIPLVLGAWIVMAGFTRPLPVLFSLHISPRLRANSKQNSHIQPDPILGP